MKHAVCKVLLIIQHVYGLFYRQTFQIQWFEGAKGNE